MAVAIEGFSTEGNNLKHSLFELALRVCFIALRAQSTTMPTMRRSKHDAYSFRRQPSVKHNFFKNPHFFMKLWENLGNAVVQTAP